MSHTVHHSSDPDVLLVVARMAADIFASRKGYDVDNSVDVAIEIYHKCAIGLGTNLSD